MPLGGSLRKRLRSKRYLSKTTSGTPRVNTWSELSIGTLLPANPFAYDAQATITSNGTYDTSTMTAWATAVSTYTSASGPLGSPAWPPQIVRKARILDYTDTVTFYPVYAHRIKILCLGWRGRIDSGSTIDASLASAQTDAESADLSVPGVTPFQLPYWVARFKCVSRQTKILGGTTDKTSIAQFVHKAKYPRTFDFRNRIPWNVVTPRAQTFYTYHMVAERVFDHTTGVEGSGLHWFGPISAAYTIGKQIRWVWVDQAVPINISEQVGEFAKHDLSEGAIKIRNNDQNIAGGYTLLSWT